MPYKPKSTNPYGTAGVDSKTVIIEREIKPKRPILKWFGRFFMLVGVMAFISSMSTLIMIAGLGKSGDPDPEAIKNGTILTFHFEGGLGDRSPAASFSEPFAAANPSLHQVTKAIRKAAKDSNVKALVARITGGTYSFTEVLELKKAIADYRATGKKAYAYASSFGDFNNGVLEYALALSFDEIWMQPMGNVTLTGFHAEVPYVKKVFDKLGVQAQIFQRKDFKTAPESALRESISEESVISYRDILGTYDETFFDAVKNSGRDIAQDNLQKLYRGVPITDEEAKDNGYIDTLGYIDELISQLEDEYGLGIKAYRNLLSYKFAGEEEKSSLSGLVSSKKDKAEEPQKTQVALIFVEGAIMAQAPNAKTAGPMAFMGGPTAGALQISSVIKKAAEDENIKLIVLRVNSPGGSPTASETLRRAVVYAQEKGKKVFLSMGDAAASGGYWISANADKIVALPTTITGSIGVFGGKVNLKGVWEKIDVKWERVAVSGAKPSTLWSQNVPYDAQAEAAINRMLDNVYTRFVSLVAEGRGMTYEQAEKLARGRVWTGKQAKKLGLVDELGGLEDTLILAAEELGTNRDDLTVRIMPEPLSPLESIIKLISGGAGVHAQAGIDTLHGVPTYNRAFTKEMLFGREGLSGSSAAYQMLNPMQTTVMQPHIHISE
jgi:protease-4